MWNRFLSRTEIPWVVLLRLKMLLDPHHLDPFSVLRAVTGLHIRQGSQHGHGAAKLLWPGDVVAVMRSSRHALLTWSWSCWCNQMDGAASPCGHVQCTRFSNGDDGVTGFTPCRHLTARVCYVHLKKLPVQQGSVRPTAASHPSGSPRLFDGTVSSWA